MKKHLSVMAVIGILLLYAVIMNSVILAAAEGESLSGYPWSDNRLEE